MSRVFDIARERLVQQRAARLAAIDAARPAPATVERHLGCSVCVGDRVFDRVTGQEGSVEGAARENVLVSTPE